MREQTLSLDKTTRRGGAHTRQRGVVGTRAGRTTPATACGLGIPSSTEEGSRSNPRHLRRYVLAAAFQAAECLGASIPRVSPRTPPALSCSPWAEVLRPFRPHQRRNVFSVASRLRGSVILADSIGSRGQFHSRPCRKMCGRPRWRMLGKGGQMYKLQERALRDRFQLRTRSWVGSQLRRFNFFTASSVHRNGSSTPAV